MSWDTWNQTHRGVGGGTATASRMVLPSTGQPAIHHEEMSRSGAAHSPVSGPSPSANPSWRPQIGDKVLHNSTGQQMTVRDTDSEGNVFLNERSGMVHHSTLSLVHDPLAKSSPPMANKPVARPLMQGRSLRRFGS